jgi:A/G-specific adenine glycosylase
MPSPRSDVAAPLETLHGRISDWYTVNARTLPWRTSSCSPWGVLVSEVMLQQTPVTRVEPVWTDWMRRWPSPAELAHDSPGAAVAAWGRLGYPRRALRLHAAATACVDRHDGTVPDSWSDLRALPGVGDYTAAAVAAFAFGRRHVVLDTNVRRVLARLDDGTEFEPPGAPKSAERACAEALLPHDPETSATWNVGLMELGALVCTSRNPRCEDCPVADLCAWQVAGRPTWSGPKRHTQPWHGTDRQARGALMATARQAYASGTGPVGPSALASAWPDDDQQRERALAGLLTDGLLERVGTAYRLPGS